MHTHTLDVDLSKVTQGENTYICTGCKQSIVLVWQGVREGDTFTPSTWGLRHKDEHINPIGEVSINYVSQE